MSCDLTLHRRRLISGTLATLAATPAWAQSAFRSDRITIEVQGRGPDVILIPGLASTAAVWRSTARGMSGRRLHLVSVRGFGEVASGSNGSGPVMGAVAQELARYIAQAGLTAPAVIGHSMGGQIGLRLAADSPARVDRLMTVDASPFFASLISPQSTSADVEPIAQLAFQAIQFLGSDALRNQGRSLGIQLGGASDAMFDAMGWQGGDRRVLAQALYETMTVDLRPRLPDITAPVTVVYGWSPDESSPRSRTDRLFRDAYARLIRPATFERIEGAEHMVMIDRPARFMAAVNRFLA